MNEEIQNRCLGKKVEEQVENIFNEAKEPIGIEKFKNSPDIQRKVKGKRKLYQLPYPIENKTLTLEDIMGRTMPDIDYVTDILSPRGYIALIGQSKKDISLLAIFLALSLSAGRAWLNRSVKPEGVSVLYLSDELSQEKPMRRIQSIFKAMEIQSNDNFTFKTVKKIPLDKPQGKQKLNKIINKCPKRPQVIILDSIYNFMSGDGKKTKDIALFVDSLKQLKNMEGGVAFVIVAYAGKKEGKRARGDSVFEGGAETLITLSDVKNKPYKKELTIKGRYIGETTLGLDLKDPIFSVKNPEITDSPKTVQAREFIQNYLRTNPEGDLRGNIVKAGKAKGWSENVMFRALRQLGSEKLIISEQVNGMPGNRKRIKLVQK